MEITKEEFYKMKQLDRIELRQRLSDNNLDILMVIIASIFLVQLPFFKTSSVDFIFTFINGGFFLFLAVLISVVKGIRNNKTINDYFEITHKKWKKKN